MKPEYREGPEAAEKFEEAMKLLLRTPKPRAKKKQSEEGATSRKSDNRDKD